MKRKVNLRLVEGSENLVTKNEILYKKDSAGKISLMKRNNKGILESITGGGGSSEGDNVAYLYPKDKSKAITKKDVQTFLNLLEGFEDPILGAPYSFTNFGRYEILYNDSTKTNLDKLWAMAEKMFPKTDDGTVATYISGMSEDSPRFYALAGMTLSFEGALMHPIQFTQGSKVLLITLAKEDSEGIVLQLLNYGDNSNDNVLSGNHSMYAPLETLIGVAPEKVTATTTKTTSMDLSYFKSYYMKCLNCIGTCLNTKGITGAGGWGCVVTPTTAGTSIANGFTANFYYIVGNLPGTKFFKGTLTGAVDSSDTTKYNITITVTPLA